MALICPQCSQIKQDDTQFCRSCGYRFQGNEQTVDEGATIRPASLASVPADADPSETLKPQPSVSQPTPVMVTPQPVAPPSSYAQPAPAQSPFYSQPVQGGYTPQQPPQHNFGQAPQQVMYGQPPQQGGYGAPVPPTSSGVSSLQRGFAGKGTPVHHQSWLIENKQIAPQTLSSTFIANLQKQNVMGVIVEPERLREQGTVLEERDYIKVRYGASSIFVYLAPMGQNLYISRTSTIQQPYSRVRMTVLIALAVLMLISLLFYAVINPDPTTSAFGFAETIKSFFFYAFFGLLFFFVIAALRSLVFLFTDNDFLAILRPNRLNDFSLDALSSIEQTTDKALRVTLQEAGLDADAIKLAHTSVPQQPLHRI